MILLSYVINLRFNHGSQYNDQALTKIIPKLISPQVPIAYYKVSFDIVMEMLKTKEIRHCVINKYKQNIHSLVYKVIFVSLNDLILIYIYIYFYTVDIYNVWYRQSQIKLQYNIIKFIDTIKRGT